MIRTIIKIDEEKCDGCGLCIQACDEGAIGLVNGKARLIRDDYCDGLGDCLPACPTGAISFEERVAAPFDIEAVKAKKAREEKAKTLIASQNQGCPGSAARSFGQKTSKVRSQRVSEDKDSMLNQWPVQLKLVPVQAAFFHNANLLVAADCSAFAYGNFHEDFMRNKVTLIGCPKLDEGSYADKLTDILKYNQIKSLTVVRMEVPCCGGLEHAVKTALKNSDELIPWQVVTISTDGKIIE